jgi:hypothetical protein
MRQRNRYKVGRCSYTARRRRRLRRALPPPPWSGFARHPWNLLGAPLGGYAFSQSTGRAADRIPGEHTARGIGAKRPTSGAQGAGDEQDI